MYIYLSGSLSFFHKTNQFNRATEWRNDLESWAKDNNIKTFNPAVTFEHDLISNRSPNIIVDQNIYFLDKCDMMVVNLDCINESPGTQFEIFYFKMKSKPVIAIDSRHNYMRGNWSPHILYNISQICNNLEDVIELISTMFRV